jgi:hypothetical protein
VTDHRQQALRPTQRLIVVLAPAAEEVTADVLLMLALPRTVSAS